VPWAKLRLRSFSGKSVIKGQAIKCTKKSRKKKNVMEHRKTKKKELILYQQKINEKMEEVDGLQDTKRDMTQCVR
jgi:hypothetical protein